MQVSSRASARRALNSWPLSRASASACSACVRASSAAPAARSDWAKRQRLRGSLPWRPSRRCRLDAAVKCSCARSCDPSVAASAAEVRLGRAVARGPVPHNLVAPWLDQFVQRRGGSLRPHIGRDLCPQRQRGGVHRVPGDVREPALSGALEHRRCLGHATHVRQREGKAGLPRRYPRVLGRALLQHADDLLRPPLLDPDDRDQREVDEQPVGLARLLAEARRRLRQPFRLVELALHEGQPRRVEGRPPAQARLAELTRALAQRGQRALGRCQVPGLQLGVNGAVERPDPRERIVDAVGESAPVAMVTFVLKLHRVQREQTGAAGLVCPAHQRPANPLWP